MKISQKVKIGLLSGVLTGLFFSTAYAEQDTDLQSRLEAAEARVAELSARTNSNWVNDTRAKETRQLVHDVLADVDTRASFQGKRSKKSVSVKVHGFMQFRWAYNHSATDGVDNTHGFSIPHARLEISGDIYLVTYGKNEGAKKMYKLFLEKDGNSKRVKTDENGKFI